MIFDHDFQMLTVVLVSLSVGKTSIAEGIAQVLVSEDCPVFLRGYRVIALEVAALTAGTKYRGEFETRLKDIIEELISSTKKTILFIDEIHSTLLNNVFCLPFSYSTITQPLWERER